MAVAYIGLGSNLGNREANLRMAVEGLGRLSRVEAVSALYETEPEGPPQPPYYNAAARIETGLEPMPLLRFLQSIEEEIGRRPGERWGPRPVDLDLLLYEDSVIEEERLVVPHPRLAERPFVLRPLADIGAEVRHPVLGRTVAELAAEAGSEGVRLVADAGWEGAARDGGPVRV